MVKKYDLLGKGFFPETLPPCFSSSDLRRAMRGLTSHFDKNQFKGNRYSDFSRFTGTKHDGNRRLYATPNPVPYYSVCSFLERNWKTFRGRFNGSPYSVSSPRLGEKNDERAVIVPSLSELAEKVSNKISFSPVMLKTDISQYFHSIYTHSIPWSAHGVEVAKADRKKESKKVRFNALDHFIQNTQRGQTRGVLIGPDAFRLVAEFIGCDIDAQLRERAGNLIVGAVRHVDDFYIGVRSEVDALAVLSHLRDILQKYELQINDAKTKIMSGLEPIDDVWAQYLRSMNVTSYGARNISDIFHVMDKAFELCRDLKTESPMKIAVRRIDNERMYRGDAWRSVEPRLQRVISYFPHSIDYTALVLVKRFAIGGDIDKIGWREAVYNVIKKSYLLNHHHEVIWLLWLLISCEIEISDEMVDELSNMKNSYVRSLLMQAYCEGKIKKKPKISMSRLETTDEFWLQNIVARSNNFTKSTFHGSFKMEFEHFSDRKLQLIDFKSHLESVKKADVRAISKSRYGYDSDEDDMDFDDDDESFSRWAGDDEDD